MSEDIPKFPELVADDTTNEQKICAWRREMVEALEKFIEDDGKRMIEIFNRGPLPNSEIRFLEGRIHGRKQMLEALKGAGEQPK